MIHFHRMETLSWKTLEFEKKDRHPDWIWTVGLIALLAAVVSFFYDNIFFGIFLIVAGAVTILYAFKHPKELSITINDTGVSINESIIPFKEITSFWLDEKDKNDKLLLLVKTSFVPTISIPLVGVSAAQVRAALSTQVKEEELRESRSIAIFDNLGF